MKSIARHAGVPSMATDAAQPHPDEGHAAHPKIARRPSQWKRVPTVNPLEEKEEAPSLSASVSSGSAWQDDPRFGIWLMGFIVLLNAVLLTLDDRSDKPKNEPSLMIQQVTRAPVLPMPHTGLDSDVHLFSGQPSQEERTTRRTIYDTIEDERFPLNESGEGASPTPGFEPGNE